MDTIKYKESVQKSEMIYSEEMSQFDFVHSQQSVDDINAQLNQTRSQRIRAAMFPESLEDYGFMKQSTNGSSLGRPSTIQRLAQPTQHLKTAIINLINYQEDADVTIRAIPELIKLLTDEDKIVVAKTLKLIDQLSSKDASRMALTSSQALISSLVNILLNSNDSDFHNAAAKILCNLSANNNKPALYAILKCGGIPALIKLLSSPIESVVFYAATTLHNLLMYEPASKAQVHHYNGTRKMVELLGQSNNQKFLAILLDSLHILAFNNSEVKLVIQTSGCPRELIRIMNSTNYQKLIWTCVRLMKVLSVCPENKRELVSEGAMQPNKMTNPEVEIVISGISVRSPQSSNIDEFAKNLFD